MAWFSTVEAYHAITLVGAFAAIMTAAFTGYHATVTWRDRRDKVRAEWSYEIHTHNDSIVFRCEVNNGTKSTLVAERVRIRGPKMLVSSQGKLEDKHESWADNQAPVALVVAPGEKSSFSVHCFPDAPSLGKEASSFWSKCRLPVSWIAWRLLSWRLPNGPKFSIRVMLRRRSSDIRPIFLKHKVRMYADSAIMLAENAEKNAAKT